MWRKRRESGCRKIDFLWLQNSKNLPDLEPSFRFFGAGVIEAKCAFYGNLPRTDFKVVMPT